MKYCTNVEELMAAWAKGTSETIHLAPGDYELPEPLERVLYNYVEPLPLIVGEGRDTFILAPGDQPAFIIRQSDDWRFGFGGGWQRLRFKGRAISIEASDRWTISDIDIDSAPGHGIEIIGDKGDQNQQRLFTIERCAIRRTEGCGIKMSYAQMSAAAMYEIKRCSFSECAGGIDARSAHGVIERNGFDRCHTKPALAITQGGAHNAAVEIHNNWFESSHDCAIEIDGLYNGHVYSNSITMGTVSEAEVGVRVGHTELPGEVRCRFTDNRWIAVGKTPFTAYDFGPRSNIIDITRDNWLRPRPHEWDGETYTKYKIPNPLIWRQFTITDIFGKPVEF